ncbi:class III lanthionine synthetase LanKC [Bacillus sp. SM2101]|uniref:class III lanthionine synthetase LanKC n=1 Tax=Bacillus sp. SM2101 TaxID=2805366 RepID=UPI001BDF1864|nr:class III lanthionine synthetase LanKC [Bacillus sp. SM2101]
MTQRNETQVLSDMRSYEHMKQDFFSLISDKNYYDSLDRYIPNDHLISIVKDKVLSDWKIIRQSIYYHVVNPKQSLPKQGWKIHISSSLLDHESVLRKVIPICIKFDTSFKFMLDKFIISISSDKNYPRSSSGKFITIYPINEAAFKTIIEELYISLKEFNGPYILSDKRYKDCKVLYYRYGGILPDKELDYDGSFVDYLSAPDGQQTPDLRLPYYSEPFWVNDPFETEESLDNSNQTEDETGLMDGRFDVLEAIRFTNSGGVYLAFDNKLKKKVIVKEARPYTGMHNEFVNSMKLREKEWDILNVLKETKVVPDPIALFYEWEHLFLVEGYIEADTLREYIASNSPFLLIDPTEKQLIDFYNNIIKICVNLAKGLEKLHKENVILVDWSPDNIFIKSDFSVMFPDLDGSFIIGKSKKNDAMYSMGFFDSNGTEGKEISVYNDFYGLGCIFLNLLSPHNNMLGIKPNAHKDFLDELVTEFGLPEEIMEIILSLMDDDPSCRPSIQDVITQLEATVVSLSHKFYIKDRISDNIISQTIQGATRFIEETATLKRNDRLYPSDAKMVNSLSISNGALGVAVTLKLINGEIPSQHINWVLKQEITCEKYPQGLYVGLSGIAWALSIIGLKDYATDVMERANNHPLLNKSTDIYTGLSGVGLANLYFWTITRDTSYIKMAKEVGDRLLDTGIKNEKGIYWPSPEGETHIGYSRGSSGTALYLLYLYQATNEQKYLDCGKEALDFDLNNSIKYEGIASFPRRVSNSNIVSPYWAFGTAGVATTVLRYFIVTESKYYKDQLNQIETDTFRKFSLFPGLYNGLSGIGNFLLDCYQFLNEEKYLHRAYDIAKSINSFKILKGDGVAFPGDNLFRINNDFGTGSSGIALFLHRLLNQGSNFNFLVDELILQEKAKNLKLPNENVSSTPINIGEK